MSTVALKNLVDPSRPITYGIVQAGEDFPGGVRYIRPIDMNGHLGVDPTQLRTTTPEIARAYRRSSLLPGDIVVSIGPGFGKTLIVPEDLVGANLTQGTARVAVRPGVCNRYLVWALQSRTSTEFWDMQIAGATFRALNLGPLSRTPIPSWAYQDQELIAAFLDDKTAKIDALIEKQIGLIRSLRARRRAVIRHTVLGRDKPPFKAVNADSPWIPEVPSGWEFVPLGYRYDAVLGKMLDAGRAPREDDADLPYIRAANIKETGLDLSSVNSMPFTPLEAVKFSLRARDLLVVEGGSVGVSVVLGQDMDGWAFQKTVNRVRALGGSSTYFLDYVLSAYRAAGVFSIVCGGSTIAHLTAEKLTALRIPVPPFDEQREIVEYLDRETARIDTLIAKSERLIELSLERRSALITAAVTGQIDVTEMESGKEAA